MIRIRDSYRAPGHIRVTWGLLIFNILSFMAAAYPATPTHSFAEILYTFGVIPAEYTSPDLLPELASHRLGPYLPIIWYQFLHGGWWHLFSNMLVLIIFGPNVEVYMGRARFLMFYLTCGAFGALSHVLVYNSSTSVLIGASGAVSGLFGAYLMLFPTNYIRITLGSIQSGNYRDIMLPVKVILVMYVITQLIDLLIPTVGGQGVPVAYMTHLGGFAAGYLLARGRGSLSSTRRNFKVFMGGKSRGGRS